MAVFKVVSSELLCDLRVVADSTCDSHVLRVFFNPEEQYATCLSIFWFCRASAFLPPNAVFLSAENSLMFDHISGDMNSGLNVASIFG